ncbi:hypothetical protein [Teredinibacter turnerae]|uniref:hypothetical protein n=1 Tax=Teredinibacter turnerae TaxID=2426 RepID=UPI00037E828D|nr:hypothetical protein [Teredinibacter turnerae]
MKSFVPAALTSRAAQLSVFRLNAIISLASALVLATLFGEFWLIALGAVVAAGNWLGETYGEPPVFIAATVPISLMIWVISSFLGFCQFQPGAALFSLTGFALIKQAIEHFNRLQSPCCQQ